MKKVLITGGSHSELPLILAAKELGYFVITTGNNIDGIGHKISDEYIRGDFSDMDFVLHLAKSRNVDGIISGCNDFAYISTAYACEKLNFKGHDNFQTACSFHQKNSFMNKAKKAGASIPKTIFCSNYDDVINAVQLIGFPIIIKPVDLTGGKGVSVCKSFKEIKTAFITARNCTRQSGVVVEQFVEGTNHGASFLIKDKKVCFSFFDNEQYYKNKYLVSGACTPSTLKQKSKQLLINDIEAISLEYNLCDGLFHTQFILNSEGIPVIIDPCRRAPGDLYIKLVEYSTGVNYAMEIVKSELGFPLNSKYNIENKCVARECIMTDKNGTFDCIEIDDTIKSNIIDLFVWAKSGDLIDDYKKYKAGIAFLGFENDETMYKNVNSFHKLIKILEK